MRLLTTQDYYKQLLEYRKHLDTLITRRAALFVTANTILFAVMNTQRVATTTLTVTLLFGLTFNLLWLLIGLRTYGTSTRVRRALAKLEDNSVNHTEQDRQPAKNAECVVFTPILTRPWYHIPANKTLSLVIPTIFAVAWILFYFARRAE